MNLLWSLPVSVPVLLVLLLTTLPSAAGAGPILGSGAGAIIEHEGFEKHFEVRVPWILRAGWGGNKIDSYIEYSTFSSAGGEGNFSVDRRWHSFLGWGVWKFAPVSGWVVPTAGGSIGAIYETVLTRVGTQSVKSTGKPQLAAAGAVGALVPIRAWLDAGLDLRMVVSDGLRPNPSFGATLTLGVRF